MQVADVGNRLADNLAFQLQHDAQHAVRGGVGRPHVQHHVLGGKVVPRALGGRGGPGGGVFECNMFSGAHG